MDKNAILCVDDEYIIVLSLKAELKNALGDRFQYEVAMDAEAAMRVIDELVGDGVRVILIISDWLMPGIKGDEFLIQVKQRYPEIKSIMITGHADERAVERVMKEAGTACVLRKPWTTHDLVEAIRCCCGEFL